MATDTSTQDLINDNNIDFLDTPQGTQLATAYQNATNTQRSDWLFLVCLFFALNI